MGMTYVWVGTGFGSYPKKRFWVNLLKKRFWTIPQNDGNELELTRSDVHIFSRNQEIRDVYCHCFFVAFLMLFGFTRQRSCMIEAAARFTELRQGTMFMLYRYGGLLLGYL